MCQYVPQVLDFPTLIHVQLHLLLELGVYFQHTSSFHHHGVVAALMELVGLPQ